jgi:hypothetical protein
MHNLESFRSLIIDVRMFLDLVNVVEKTFEILLLQKELFVSFQLSLKFFVCFFTWSEEDKVYYLSLIVTPSEVDKSNMSFIVFSLQRLMTFRVWWSSEATSSDSRTSESDLNILVQNFIFFWNSNCTCSSRTKTWFNTLNFSPLSYTLEDTITYSICPLILSYHQNFRNMVQNPFCFNNFHLVFILIASSFPFRRLHQA